MTDEDIQQQRAGLAAVLGPSNPLPQELRDLVAWGAEQDKLMGIRN